MASSLSNYRTKRDVDVYVASLEKKLAADELSVKSLFIAKAYKQVGEFSLAKRYADRYASVRPNASSVFGLLADLELKLGTRDSALKLYEKAFSLDESEARYMLAICDIMGDQVNLDDEEEVKKADTWLNRAKKKEPRHPSVRKLQDRLDKLANGNKNVEEDRQTNNASHIEEVSNQVPSSPFGLRTPASIMLNRSSAAVGAGSPARIAGLDRLEAQVASLERSQEKMTREFIKGHSAMLNELVQQKESMEGMRSALLSGFQDMKIELANLCVAMQDAKTLAAFELKQEHMSWEFAQSQKEMLAQISSNRSTVDDLKMAIAKGFEDVNKQVQSATTTIANQAALIAEKAATRATRHYQGPEMVAALSANVSANATPQPATNTSLSGIQKTPSNDTKFSTEPPKGFVFVPNEPKTAPKGFVLLPEAAKIAPISSTPSTDPPATTLVTPTSTTVTAVPALGAIKSSGVLSFEDKSLKLDDAASASSVVSAINACTNMLTLVFAGNTVGVEAARVIGEALKKHPELERAKWRDMFTGRSRTEIPEALKLLSQGIISAQSHLVELDLSDNAIGPIGMEGIVELLESPCCYTLKELKLNNTGCGVTGGKRLAKALLKNHDQSSKLGKPLSLKVFTLGRSRQENDGSLALSEVFSKMTSLEEVRMPQNGIYHQGLTALLNALALNPSMRILDLNDNTFTVKGAEALANVLPKMPNLISLNLGDCLLKNEGAKLVIAALRKSCTKLENVHFDSNEMRADVGLEAIEMTLEKPSLKMLTLDANQFGSKAIDDMMALLKSGGKEDVVGDIEDDCEPEDEDEVDEDDENYEDYEEEDEDDHEVYGDEEENGKQELDLSTNEGPKAASSNIFSFSFGAPRANSTETSLATLATTTTVSIFGTSNTTAMNASSNIFGTKSVTATTTSATPALTTGGSSIFNTSFNTSSEKPSLFANLSLTSSTQEDNKNTSGSIFGSAEPVVGKGVDLSANKNLFSFASLASGKTDFSNNGNFLPQNSNSSFSFKGAGTAIFDKSTDNTDHDEGLHQEDDSHDPHFEPVVPLPEVVEVKTGEEDETVLFKHRAKVYRFDPSTKEWKERGVGDIKILEHPELITYRVLLRREQVLKPACNFLIDPNIELEAMAGSNTSLCFFVMDAAEGEPKMEKLAVKFKLVETKDDFKKTFEECQQKKKEKGSPQK